jgi:hypothetical protein
LATISNLYIDAGSDYSSIITVAAANGGPLNLGPYTVKSQMRRSFKSSVAYNFEAVVANASAGQIRIILPADVSEQMEPGRWLYDVEITHSQTGLKKRVVEGVVVITPQITQI